MTEQTSKALKITLSTLLVVLLAMLAYIFLAQKNNETISTVPTTITPTTVSDVPTQTEQSTINTPANTLAPAPALSQEEIAAQFKVLRDQVDAGTLSPEEARKQLEALNVPITPSATTGTIPATETKP